MLHARKGKYQSTMARKPITIRKIPRQIVWEVRDHLEETIKLDDIYFANRKDKNAPRWAVINRDDTEEFKDITLKFKASSALKNLIKHALKINTISHGELPSPTPPQELGYAPFALALSNPDSKWWVDIKIGRKKYNGYTWPGLIKRHISHWYSNKLAREYATNDVIYTRLLYKHLDSPKPGDDDSELACMVGASRWRGYLIDIEKAKTLREKQLEISTKYPKAPAAVQTYLRQVMTKTEADIILEEGTKKIILEGIADWKWEGLGDFTHPAAERAADCLKARKAYVRVANLDKLLLAGRFHASFDIIGAKSGRMSGRGGGLNPQGIESEEFMREIFTLKHKNEILCGGDFEAFEVGIGVASWGDEKLEALLKEGKKIHALFGVHAYPGMTYDEVMNDHIKYGRAKSGVFAVMYGGEAYTLQNRLGIELKAAEIAYENFITEFPGVGKGRSKIFDMFRALRQPTENGPIYWNTPKEYIETMLGFPRYFTLENRLCETLFKLAQKPPKSWSDIKGKVIRRERKQTVSGACRSAIYGAAFAIQGSNMRAAANHVIQGTGSQITKRTQRNIWDLQPFGVSKWVVQPMNVHDEIVCPTHNLYTADTEIAVAVTVESFKKTVPLIGINWKTNLNSWAEVK